MAEMLWQSVHKYLFIIIIKYCKTSIHWWHNCFSSYIYWFSLECLEWLIKYSEGDPLIFANDGMAPIHAAAQAGELECLKWLIRHGGVSITQKAEDGATPMHFAAAGGQVAFQQFNFNSFLQKIRTPQIHYSKIVFCLPSMLDCLSKMVS